MYRRVLSISEIIKAIVFGIGTKFYISGKNVLRLSAQVHRDYFTLDYLGTRFSLAQGKSMCVVSEKQETNKQTKNMQNPFIVLLEFLQYTLSLLTSLN